MIPITTTDESKIAREIRAMTSFKHQFSSNMVENLRCSTKLPNVSAAPPYSCIVMNQIDGEPLTAVLFRSGSNPAMAWKLLNQIATVLRDMHAQQLVHRDIWSENIMVGKDGNFYLIDYGCAESAVSPSATSVRESLNIPYLSPQICMKLPPSTSDDMWALGLVLLELVTGQHIIHRMGSNEAPFFTKDHLMAAALKEVEAKGGPQMGAILRKLLAMEASQRATANDVLGMGQQPMARQAILETASPLRSAVPFGAMGHPGTIGSSLQAPVGGPPPFIPQVQSAPSFTNGQKIQYKAKSHDAYYQGNVLGRGSDGTYRIQLQGGRVVEVSSQETWRLKADGQDWGVPRRPGSLQAPVATPMMQDTGALIGSMSAPLTAAPSMVPGVLQIGAVVNYMARTKNQTFKAVILGRNANPPGWIIRIDANKASPKVIPDTEAWRLTPC
jgi:serine/threonine protein kinase